MRKTVLTLGILVSIVACKKFDFESKKAGKPLNEHQVSVILNNDNVSFNMELEELQSEFRKVGEFHNMALEKYFQSHPEKDANHEEQFKAFLAQLLEENSNDLCGDCLMSETYLVEGLNDKSNEELMTSLEDEFNFEFSEVYKEAVYQVEEILSQDAAADEIGQKVDEVVASHFGAINNDIEKIGLVAMAEVGKASYSYWQSHLQLWDEQYDDGVIMADTDHPVAKADAWGAKVGAVKGGVAGAFSGGAIGAFAGAILGSATSATIKSFTAAFKEVLKKE